MHHKFYLAPLRGVTDCVFRTAFERRFGKFDVLLAPFITTVKGKDVTASHIKDVAGMENDRARLVPQILGNDPDEIIVLVNTLSLAGYKSVNLNLGCPHPQVSRKKRGSGLLPYPEMAGAILAKVTAGIDSALSVKVRLGRDDAGELQRLMPVLNGCRLAEVIIHPRTGKQGYTGRVDLDRFTEAAAMCVHPVVYNGDIADLAGFQDRCRMFPGIGRWMIGRGVAQNPYLLMSIQEGREVIADPVVLRAFHDEIYAENRNRLFGPSHLLGKMKEFWSYFSFSFSDGKKVLKEIVHCTGINEYEGKVGRLFDRKK